MEQLTVVFQNIAGGCVMVGKTHGEMVFSRVSLKEYITHFETYQPDILSLNEVHMEDAQGNSNMVQHISRELRLPYFRTFAQSSSHLDSSKYQGLAILSKYPIKECQQFLIPNPHLEIDRPDGTHWSTFDKGALKLTLDIDGTDLNVFNLHYFPFHLFNHRMNEDAFSTIRRALMNILLAQVDKPTIITGDFNNKGLSLDAAFPELFLQDNLRQSVVAETTVVGLREQFDCILYTPTHFELTSGSTKLHLSDHYAVVAKFSFKQAII